MPPWMRHVREWSGLVSLIGLLLFGFRALGFASTSTGTRIDVLELRAKAADDFMQEQKALNNSLRIYMCVGDYDSAILAGIRCRDLGVDRLESKQ